MTQVDKNLDEHVQGLNAVAGPDNTVEPGHGHEPDSGQYQDVDEQQGRIPVVETMVEGDRSKYHYVDYYDG